MEQLNCSGNQLDSLDNSANFNLEELYCEDNQIVNLVGFNTDPNSSIAPATN